MTGVRRESVRSPRPSTAPDPPLDQHHARTGHEERQDRVDPGLDLAGPQDPPRPRVLMLTTFDLDEYVYEAL